MPCERPILDRDEVFRLCHQRQWNYEKGCPDKAAFHFDPADEAISVYVNSLIAAPTVLRLHDRPGRPAAAVNGLLSLQVNRIRSGEMLDVLHAPHDPGALHIAHSKIVKRPPAYHKLRAQKLLVEASSVVISVPPLHQSTY